MWSGSNQRIKALMSAREREKQRLSRPIHLMRANIRLVHKNESGTEIEVPARALLNEFSSSGICLFTMTPLTPNLEMVLELVHPQKFTLQARVIWCQYQPSSSHVLTSKPYAYRLGLAFRFEDAAQQESFKKFCTEMAERYAQAKPGVAPSGTFSAAASPDTPVVEGAPVEGSAPSPVPAEAVAAPAAVDAATAAPEAPVAESPPVVEEEKKAA